MELIMDHYEAEMVKAGLTTDQIEKMRLFMAHYALDALYDSRVAAEANGICEVDRLLAECRKWKLTPEELRELNAG